jgi:hypothetical protein
MSNPQRGGDYVLVPRSPTSEMVDAGRAAMSTEKFVSHARAIWVWQDMVKAAPQPPSSPVDSGEVVTDAIIDEAVRVWFATATAQTELDAKELDMRRRMRAAYGSIMTALTHRLTAKLDHSGVPSGFERLTVTRENGDTITGYVTPQYAAQAMLMPTVAPAT